jgi:PAP2 superfamily
VAGPEEIFDAEQLLHLNVERGLDRLVQASDWIDDAVEHYYKTLHFAVPLAVLAWLYWRRPERYRPARTVLFASTGLALIGFWAYPLAPPRLAPSHGFPDTLHPTATRSARSPSWPTNSRPCPRCTSPGRRGAHS